MEILVSCAQLEAFKFKVYAIKAILRYQDCSNFRVIIKVLAALFDFVIGALYIQYIYSDILIYSYASISFTLIYMPMHSGELGSPWACQCALPLEEKMYSGVAVSDEKRNLAAGSYDKSITTKLSQVKLFLSPFFSTVFVEIVTLGERLVARVHGISISWCPSNLWLQICYVE